MMVNLKSLNNTIELSDSSISVLAVENKQLYRQIVLSFEEDNADENFVFSENFEPFEFSKKGLFISNAIDIELNSKKLITKITTYLETISNNELETELSQIRSELISFADKLCFLTDFDCTYNSDILTPDIIKLLQFKVGVPENTEAENFILFILLCSKYLKTKLFVVPNLHIYFDTEELKSIYETLIANHVILFVLECFTPKDRIDFECVHIVDKDLCLIDKFYY